MNIVTGFRGVAHVSSNADQSRNMGIFGSGNYVLNVGEKFAATLTDANTVTLADGEGMMQGVHFRIEPGTTEAVTIANGTQGYNRIDLIVARYTKDAQTGVEDVALEVIQGTPSDSTPTEPTYTTGDIRSGDLAADFPLYRVTLTGLTPAIAQVATVSYGSAADAGLELGAAVEWEFSLAHGVEGHSDAFTLAAGVYLCDLFLLCNGVEQGSYTPSQTVGVQTADGQTNLVFETFGITIGGGSDHRVGLFKLTEDTSVRFFGTMTYTSGVTVTGVLMFGQLYRMG